MLAGQRVVIRIGAHLQMGHHHAGAHKACVKVRVGVRNVPVLDAWQPDHLAHTQQTAQLGFAVGLAPAGVAVVVQHTAFRDDGRPLAIDFQGAAFQHQRGAQHGHLCLGADHVGHLAVQFKLLLFAPAIEVELHARTLAIGLAYKNGTRVAHPQIVHLGRNQLDACIQQLPRIDDLSGPHQHVDGFVGRNRVGNARQCQLHLRHLCIAPYGAGGTIGHPGRLVGLGLVGHAPLVGRVRCAWVTRGCGVTAAVGGRHDGCCRLRAAIAPTAGRQQTARSDRAATCHAMAHEISTCIHHLSLFVHRSGMQKIVAALV